MNNSSTKQIVLLVGLPVFVIGLCLTGAGCGGGANAVTTVTLKPADLESDGVEGATVGGGGDKPKTGGGPAAGPGNLVGRFVLDGGGTQFVAFGCQRGYRERCRVLRSRSGSQSITRCG